MDQRTLLAARLWTLAVPAVSAFVGSLVRNFQDRDDVMQETAAAVLGSFDRYDPTQSFTAWAVGIARNQMRLHFRRKGRDRLVFDSETVDRVERAFADADPKDQRLDYLGDCFELLDPKAQELCRLRYEADLKPAAIAFRTGSEPNTVAKALQRIRDRLRACIESKLAEPGVAR